MNAMKQALFPAILAAVLLLGATPLQAQPGGEAGQFIAQWKTSNALCRNAATPALEAIASCEQRDTYSKLLSASNYCYGPVEDAAAG